MRNITLLIISIFVSSFSFGQTIIVQSGASVSKLSYEVHNMCLCPGERYQKDLIGYSEFAGIDYFDKKYVDISSNVGVIRKGGSAPDQPWYKNTTTLDYTSINTAISLKYPIEDKIFPFLSFGPRIDFLRENNHKEFTMESYNNTTWGLILGGGIKYNISRYQIGLRYDKYFNFTKVGEIPSYSVYDKTFTINMIFGYKLE